MSRTISIRAEQPDDAVLISRLVADAYADVAYSDHREHIMIERMRGTAAYLPELSLIAEVEGQPAGHILMTRAHIRSGSTSVDTLALAPLSVVPAYQGRGVGKRLVTEAHARAAALGFATVILVGIPHYYPRFGYEPLGRYPITLPFAAPDEDCMVLALAPGALEGVAGQVAYAEAWLTH